jgi:hypothetical protein
MESRDPARDEALASAGDIPQPIKSAMQTLSLTRLCKTCRHAEKPLMANWLQATCVRQNLPVNLVTGERKFPCIIARGYVELCGPLGVFHERR